MSEFHFLRPLWFLALIPAIWLLLKLWRKQSSGTTWHRVFDDHLLANLWLESPGKSSRLPLLILAIGWLLAIIILAGPVWERQPEQVWRAQMSRVVILDLSTTMNANDLSPSRLERARFKIQDILARSTEGRTGLVVFAGDAHIVTPLTEDNETIKNLITALDTKIMPQQGDAATPALQMARELLNLTGIFQGEILLISDGISDPATALVEAQKLREQGYRLSILGVGTEQGGTITNNGTAEFIRFNPTPLQELARAGGGYFSMLTTDEKDLNRLLPDITATGTFDKIESSGVERWIEYAVWLLPALLLLAAIAFRRGWLLGLLFLLPPPPPAYAFSWQDLWTRPDQQAQTQFNQGNTEAAAQQFRDANWRGTALYETGDYQAAAEAFAESNELDAKYNQGNALARAGELQQAIDAYREVLQQDPTHEDAQANLELLEELMQQQESQDNEDSDQQDSDQNDSDDSNNNDDSDDNSNTDDNQSDEQHADEDNQQDEDNNQSQSENEPSDSDSQSEEPLDQSQANADEQDQDEQQESDQLQNTIEQDAADDDTLPSEEDIALEQWLKQIPEDPSGLLRRKFMLEHLQRQQSR